MQKKNIRLHHGALKRAGTLGDQLKTLCPITLGSHLYSVLQCSKGLGRPGGWPPLSMLVRSEAQVPYIIASPKPIQGLLPHLGFIFWCRKVLGCWAPCHECSPALNCLFSTHFIPVPFPPSVRTSLSGDERKRERGAWVGAGVCIELASDEAGKGEHVLTKKMIVLNFSYLIEYGFEIESQKN